MKKYIILIIAFIIILGLSFIYDNFYETNIITYEQIEKETKEKVKNHFTKNNLLPDEGDKKELTLEDLKDINIGYKKLDKCKYSYFIIENNDDKITYQMCIVCDDYDTSSEKCMK